jgi:hypothetical protein
MHQYISCNIASCDRGFHHITDKTRDCIVNTLEKLQDAIQTSLLKKDLLETRSNVEIINGSILVCEEYRIVENLSSVGKNVRITCDVEKTHGNDADGFNVRRGRC